MSATAPQWSSTMTRCRCWWRVSRSARSTRERLLRQVATVQTGGRTNLSGGWLTGCEQVAAHLGDGVLSRALLLTDGLANEGITDREELAAHAKALRQRGISTTTLGVGEDFDEFLLQAMADAGGGHFYFVANPEQIPDFFKGELGEMLEVVAREILLILPLPAGWRVDVLNDLEHEVVGGELRLGLGEAYRDEVRDVLLRLDLPAAPLAGTYELTPRLSYRAVGGPQQVQVVGETVSYVVGSPEQVARQAVDQEVLGLAARLEAERAKIKALRLERDGLREEALVALQEANALVLGIAGPAQAAPLQSELDRLGEEVTIGLSARERKAQHYTVAQDAALAQGLRERSAETTRPRSSRRPSASFSAATRPTAPHRSTRFAAPPLVSIH